MLLVIEFVADKIPAVDHANDVVQTVLRPTAGAILMLSASGQIGKTHPVLMIVAGHPRRRRRARREGDRPAWP